jgi:hypothetical protein
MSEIRGGGRDPRVANVTLLVRAAGDEKFRAGDASDIKSRTDGTDGVRRKTFAHKYLRPGRPEQKTRFRFTLKYVIALRVPFSSELFGTYC